MKIFTAIIEKDKETGLYVGYVPRFRGAHSQGETLDELQPNWLSRTCGDKKSL